MKTPVADFVKAYREAGCVRMHMPGHKGQGLLGPEALDITEIEGADVLYDSRGILRESEDNAARLFGAGRTLYSAEGSSLCIRAMLALAALTAREKGLPCRVLAGRNAHRTLMTAAALLDLEIAWMRPRTEGGLLTGGIRPGQLAEALDAGRYMAVYLTSPDYPGHLEDIAGAARVCHERGVPLLVDNAHGAYLKFLPEDLHPMTLGADMCCDSAHKTLDCLTGAAYLHIAKDTPGTWTEQAEAMMALFASTSPSYLILQSLDLMNAALAGDYPGRLARSAARLAEMKERLRKDGWDMTGQETMKLTLKPKSRGWRGTELQERLREEGIRCEFADPDYLVMMPSPRTGEEDWRRTEEALRAVPCREPIREEPPAVPAAERVCGIREAMLSPRERVNTDAAEGRILADPLAGCPPAVPPVTAGERISRDAAACLRYYGISQVMVLREKPEKSGFL